MLLALGATSALGQDLRLPFTGRWFVYQGGDTPNVNHHMSVRAQWFGVDFAKVGGDSQRELSVPNPTKPQDFYCWNEPVLSPVAGEVHTVVNHLPDNPLGTRDLHNPAGNHLVIATREGRFVFLAHFQRASIGVEKGAQVATGQVLGRCGNSGNTDFPHVHVHVQDSLVSTAMGQNPVFARMDVELNGKSFKAVTWPLIRGLFVTAR
ncbi:M23 family metallopeptidase [uncultured Azohydromonas sp.]|uniref:M23 family metallopeptidase n=1 Tax=uncultured Azohydromonas sp. TaxID=487342 RepID=UPI00262845F8|nr:M23 family metallopeptidase [uncultured Azohydromonas sp.]